MVASSVNRVELPERCASTISKIPKTRRGEGVQIANRMSGERSDREDPAVDGVSAAGRG